MLDTEKLTTHFFEAASLPAEPAIPDFKIHFGSEMHRLQSVFARVGLTSYTGKKSVFMTPPVNDRQKSELRKEGIDPYVCQKRCSPRRP